VALLGNISLLHKSPAKYTTGTVGFNDRANWNKPGQMRNRGNLTLSTLWAYDAIPSGTYAGRAYFAPQKAGRLVTRSAFGIDASATGAMGLPGAASATITLDASAIGGLFAGGVASCTITFTASGSIAGLAAGSAAATIGVSASAVPGATAWGVANGAFSVSGTAVAYGLAYGSASTVDNSVMTPASITAAVWSAVAADSNVAGSMGAKLNSAASGGVDYDSMATATAIAIRANLAAELARIDTTISSRATVGDIFAAV